MMERHNRKSHLAPKLSPSTQALLRGESVASPLLDTSNTKTPTSGDIPIGGADVRPPLPTAIPSEINGSSGPSSSSNGMYDRPPFPPRTSSSGFSSGRPQRDNDGYAAITIQTRGRENGDVYGNASTPLAHPKDGQDGFSLPIRPAPTGPLPPPPGSKTPRSAGGGLVQAQYDQSYYASHR